MSTTSSFKHNLHCDPWSNFATYPPLSITDQMDQKGLIYNTDFLLRFTTSYRIVIIGDLKSFASIFRKVWQLLTFWVIPLITGQSVSSCPYSFFFTETDALKAFMTVRYMIKILLNNFPLIFSEVVRFRWQRNWQ